MRVESYGQGGEGVVDRLLSWLRRRRVDPHVRRGCVLVDLGCGHEGKLLRHFAPRIARGIGFDVSVAGAPATNAELHAQLVDRPLPLADGSVDVVTCLAVIEHVEQPATLVAEARRILRPGGVFVVTTPTPRAAPILKLLAARLRLIDADEIEDHRRLYSPAELFAELARGGFDPARIRTRRFELGLNVAAVAHV